MILIFFQVPDRFDGTSLRCLKFGLNREDTKGKVDYLLSFSTGILTGSSDFLQQEFLNNSDDILSAISLTGIYHLFLSKKVDDRGISDRNSVGKCLKWIAFVQLKYK